MLVVVLFLRTGQDPSCAVWALLLIFLSCGLHDVLAPPHMVNDVATVASGLLIDEEIVMSYLMPLQLVLAGKF